VDLRNIYRPDEMRARGFDYVGVGSAPVRGAQAPHLLRASS
jgi:hypothetical protein